MYLTKISLIVFAISTLSFCRTNSRPENISTQKISESKDTIFNFENYVQNNLPKTWELALTGKGRMCNWKVVNDKGNKVMAQLSSEKPDYRFNMVINKQLFYKDVEISVKFKGISGNNDQGGGPVWRYRDENNYYTARANPLENNFRVYKVSKGKRRELASARISINSNQWYTLKIRMKGDKIQCFFENKLALEVEDNTFPNAGKIGLWTKSDAVTYFDDIKIKNT